MVRKLATKFLAVTLAVLMVASTVPIPTNSNVYASEFTVQQQPPPQNPQAPIGSFRNTEVVSLWWDLEDEDDWDFDFDFDFPGFGFPGWGPFPIDWDDLGPAPIVDWDGVEVGLQPSPFAIWLENNAGYYNTVRVSVFYGDEVVRLYRIPYQGSFIFSTNQQTHHPQLSREDVRFLNTRFFPLPDYVVVLQYYLESWVPLPSGHFTVPYNLFWSIMPMATGDNDQIVSGGTAISPFSWNIGGLAVSVIINRDINDVDWYLKGEFLDAGVPGAVTYSGAILSGGQRGYLHTWTVTGEHAHLHSLVRNVSRWSSPYPNNFPYRDSFSLDMGGEAPRWRDATFTGSLGGLQTIAEQIHAGDGGGPAGDNAIQTALGTLSRSELVEPIEEMMRRGYACEGLLRQWYIIRLLTEHMGHATLPGQIQTLIDSKGRTVPPDLPQLIVIFEPIVGFVRSAQTLGQPIDARNNAITTVNEWRRRQFLSPPDVRLIDNPPRIFLCMRYDTSSNLARMLHYDENIDGVERIAEGINTLFSAFPPRRPGIYPRFYCIYVDEDFLEVPATYLRRSSDDPEAIHNTDEWIEAVAEELEARGVTMQEVLADPALQAEIEDTVSRELWPSWYASDKISQFAFGPFVLSREEFWDIVEAVCDPPEQCIDANGDGEECCEEGDPECTPEECIDDVPECIKEDCPPEQCIEEKDDCIPPPDEEHDCFPEDISEMCGTHECEHVPRKMYYHEDMGEAGLQDSEEFFMRWHNIPFAFGETHMATSGFENLAPSAMAHEINLTRTQEVFQAMAGMPETEFLYINLGAREGAFDVDYRWHRRVYQFIVWWIETDYCPLYCDAWTNLICYDCGGNCCPLVPGPFGPVCGPPINVPKTYAYTNNNVGGFPGSNHDDWGRRWSYTGISALPTGVWDPIFEVKSFKEPGAYRRNADHAIVEFRFLEIRHGQARAATDAQVYNPHLYSVPLPFITQTPITLEDLSTNIYNDPNIPIEPGRKEDEIYTDEGRHYGTDGNLSIFRYEWFAGKFQLPGWGGKPSTYCEIDPSDADVFRQFEEEAWEAATAELGLLFSWNANLVYLLGVNEYQFVRTGGHASGPSNPVLIGGPGGENLITGKVEVWHDPPNPPDWGLFHSAPNTNYFAPRGEQWHSYEIVPISGFTGRSHRNDAMRNSRHGHNPPHVNPSTGLPHKPEYYCRPENIALAWRNTSTSIIRRLHNNIYNFMPFLDHNWINYITYELTFGDPPPRDVRSVTAWQGMAHTGYGAYSPPHHIAAGLPNHVRLEYTAWQEPSSPYHKPQGPHQGTWDATAYMGPNPVIIHNPVSSIFAWVHDVPTTVLQDQRINTVSYQSMGMLGPHGGLIVPHDRRTDYRAAARLYVDFDFRITIPNDGMFTEYWHFYPRQYAHPVGRERFGPTQYSPLTGDYIGRGLLGQQPDVLGMIGSSFDGRRPGGVTAPASGLTSSPLFPGRILDNAPLVHNTGFGQVGLRGPGWIGEGRYWQPIRNHANPYGEIGSGQGPSQTWGRGPDIWDVSKWIDAKYIQFPFDVYFYGAFVPPFSPPHPGSQVTTPPIIGSPFTQFERPFAESDPGHPGGFYSQFVPAGRWITLYDNQTHVRATPSNDPTEFAFRIPSHVADLRNQKIRIVARTINSPSTDPDDLWYGGSEWNINGARLPQDTGTRNTASTHPTGSSQDQEAFHATATVLTVDVIGRIGNVLVDDIADPQWTNVFWNTDNLNRPLTNSPVWRAIGQHYNMFESTQNMGGLNNRPWHPRTVAPGGIFNRFSQLAQWHGMSATLLYPEHHGVYQPYTLPVERNPQPQYSMQVPSLGYEFQFSIQTLGRYGDGEMWVHPRYILLGDWTTHPDGSDHAEFQLFATNPFDPFGARQMFWDSSIDFTNWQFGSTGAVGGDGNMAHSNWTPYHHHQIWHSLADPRAKVNDVERNTFSFNEAVRLGQLYSEYCEPVECIEEKPCFDPDEIEAKQYLNYKPCIDPGPECIKEDCPPEQCI